MWLSCGQSVTHTCGKGVRVLGAGERKNKVPVQEKWEERVWQRTSGSLLKILREDRRWRQLSISENHLYYYLTNIFLNINTCNIAPSSSLVLRSSIQVSFFANMHYKKYVITDILKIICVLLKSLQSYQRSQHHP